MLNTFPRDTGVSVTPPDGIKKNKRILTSTAMDAYKGVKT
jgi:hypothetical protein